LYIAERETELIKIIDISRELSISESLLRRIISDLERTNILSTIKGRS
jgi:DNA-binding IscR family transcriptional regulator